MSKNNALVIAVLAILVVILGVQVSLQAARPAAEPTVAMDGRRVGTSGLAERLHAVEQERDKARVRVTELETDLRAAQEKAAASQAAPDPDADPVGAAKAAKLKKLLDTTEWSHIAKAVLGLLQADEESRRTGKPPTFDPKLLGLLTQSQMRLGELAKLLGIKNYMDVPFNDEIAPYFFVGWLEAVGVELTPEQEAKVKELAVESTRDREKRRTELTGSNKLERMLAEGEGNLVWEDHLRGVLRDDQEEKWAAPQGADPFWGRQANRHEIGGADAGATGQAVGEFWTKSFGLDASQRPVVDDVAGHYAEEARRREEAFRAQYPANPPRAEQMKHAIDMLRLQVDSERQLAQRVNVPQDQRWRLNDGSGTILQYGQR